MCYIKRKGIFPSWEGCGDQIGKVTLQAFVVHKWEDCVAAQEKTRWDQVFGTIKVVQDRDGSTDAAAASLSLLYQPTVQHSVCTEESCR